MMSHPYFVSLCRLARQAFTTWRSILTNMARILQLTSRQAQRELMLRQAIKFAGWIHRRSLGSWSKSCQLTRFLTAFLGRSGRLGETGTGEWQSAVGGKSVSVRVEQGGGSIIK